MEITITGHRASVHRVEMILEIIMRYWPFVHHHMATHKE